MTTAYDHGGDLATLVREHVQRDEPPFLMSPDTVIAVGRRTLVRRRARRGLVGVVVAAAAVAALPLMPWHGSAGSGDKTGIDPATTAALENYDAQKMPQLIDEHARAALGAGLTGLGEGEFRAGDDQGAKLPSKYYDKASSMAVSYGADRRHQVVVSLMHARSEAEGDARKICTQDVESGYALTCTVTTGADGDLITTRVTAMRRLDQQEGWAAVMRDEIRTGVPVPGDLYQEPIEPDQLYFQRSVESVHSETFLTSAWETVKAPDLETANGLWQVPVTAMEAVVTDPALVIPKPPLGDHGCAWTLDDTVTCTKDPNVGQN